jgi:flagellar hook-associated protein 2
MSGTASISGVISGLKTDDIITKMMDLAKVPMTRMQDQKTVLQNKTSAWQEVNTRLLALKANSDALTNPTAFRTTTFTSSNTDLLTGSTSSAAEAGSYYVKVNTIAKTNQLKTQGFADVNSASLGAGAITLGAGPSSKAAADLLADTIQSVTLAANTKLSPGAKTLVVDTVATSATREMGATYAGADVDTARAQDAGAAGNVSINGVSFAFDDDATLGSVVDAINGRSTETGVTAQITGSSDNWHVTLTQQTHGTHKQIAYTEDASVLNGGSGNDYTVAGTNALAHIGATVFDAGVGDTLQNADGDMIVLKSDATTGTKADAFDVVGSHSITIDNTNNTLAGLRDAINAAGAGVKASIVNDGSGTSPYRLVLTSNTSGTAGEITVDTSNLVGGTAPGFSTLQAAQDASLTLGEGAGAVTVTKSTNTITDLITGVTLNLKDQDSSKTVELKIGQDTSAAKASIKAFVAQYNNLTDYIGLQFKYDASTNATGTLFADSRLQSLLSDLRSDISNPLSGVSQGIKVMSQIGITSTVDDQLQIDDSALDAALANNPTEVQKLFANVGETTNTNVSFVSASSKTKASSTDGYEVNITQVATQAYVKVGAKQTGALAQSETLTLNGVTIDLAAGMTQDQVVKKINDNNSQTGVTASITDGYLMLKRDSYGSASHISIKSSISTSANAGANSGIGLIAITESGGGGELGTGTGVAGLDVQGTINGEAATGSGQFLTGKSGNLKTDGLTIRYTGAGTGVFGKVHYTQGIAGLFSEYAASATGTKGLIASAEDGLQTQSKGLDDDMAKLQARLTLQEERLNSQFAAMENALGQLQSQSQQLTAQITSMNKTNQ